MDELSNSIFEQAFRGVPEKDKEKLRITLSKMDKVIEGAGGYHERDICKRW